MKKLFPLCCVLLLACNESKLSKGPVNSLSLIRAEINIGQSLQHKNDNRILISLYDSEGKTIKNDSIKINVNGTAVPYTVREGLYYTSSTFYLKDSVAPRDNKFSFEIVLPGGQKIFLAEIEALNTMNGQNIMYTEAGDLKKDVEVKWKGLEGISYLVINKSMQVKKREDPHVTVFEGQTPDTIPIPATGSHVIPKSTFEDSVHLISILSFMFVAEKNGALNPQLVPGSSIHIQGSMERSVSFE